MTCYTTAKLIVQKLTDKGHIAYFAGGYVRDRLMGHPSDDIDIATSASTDEVMAIFEKTIPVGIQFGIVIVVENDHHFEVATFREESDYKDGRRPSTVSQTSPEIDALRRDFTINGMFFDPLTEEVIDYVSGQDDLNKEIVRAIGDPHHRFNEDRLRMIRAARYAARFNFAIDPFTLEAILVHAPELFPSVAIERVWHELQKMHAFDNFANAICLLHQFTLLGCIFEELEETPLEVIEEKARFMEKHPTDSPLIAKIFELFPEKNLTDRLLLLDKLKLSNEERRFTEQLETLRMANDLDDYDWAKIYAIENINLLLAILAIHRDDAWLNNHKERQKRLQQASESIKHNKRVVTSKHLIDLGISPGPKLGRMLEKAFRIAVNHKLDAPEEIIPLLLEEETS